ncbi:MAG: hypothetical protein DRN21_02005 [Thermoplasmata archaeon]|nr:MAG: hypothetical protein DRN21_02005 [Thermoplasmata archaeon]
MNYEDEGSGWSSYWDTWQGCRHSSIDIDVTTGLFYAAFDWYNQTNDSWDIVLLSADCKQLEEEDAGERSWIMGGDMDEETCPAVAAANDYIYVVAQYDQLAIGQQDLVCYYSSDGGSAWSSSMVAASADDELYPSVVAYGDTATCTFTKNGNLYVTFTSDGGATWSDPEQVNDNEGTVIEEYHNAEVIPGGNAVWMDSRNGESDIYHDNVGTPVPVITIKEIRGGFGISATLENIGGMAGTQIPWSISFDGLVFLGKEKSGTVDIDAGESVEVKTGLILGIGRADITVTAGGAAQTVSGFVLGPLVLGVS